jgi:hypothetical protein
MDWYMIIPPLGFIERCVRVQDIVFDGEFEEETDICSICGADSSLTGWNEEKELSRFECADCGAVFIYDNDYNETLLKGEVRDWEKFLSKNLSFPFTAIVTEFQGDNIFIEEQGPIKQSDKVLVNKVVGEDDLYGVIVAIKIGKKLFHFPLCDLDVLDKKCTNHKLVQNYGVWFANCR